MLRTDCGRGCLILGVMLAELFAAGCGDRQPAKEPLRVAAASDLQQALPVLATRFQAAHGVKVVCSFGSSGHLSEQIKGGAPFDVFMAANQAYVNELAKLGLVRGDSVNPYAQGSLVVVVNKAAGVKIERLDDLAEPHIKKIAIANPAFAPYGAAARQALTRADLWDQLKPKIVQSETVRQALEFVESGNAEAGMVGRAIAGVPEVNVVNVDPGLYDPIVQALAIVTNTRRIDDSQAFTRFVLGDEGQSLLAQHGFTRGDAAGSRTLPDTR